MGHGRKRRRGRHGGYTAPEASPPPLTRCLKAHNTTHPTAGSLQPAGRGRCRHRLASPSSRSR